MLRTGVYCALTKGWGSWDSEGEINSSIIEMSCSRIVCIRGVYSLRTSFHRTLTPSLSEWLPRMNILTFSSVFVVWMVALLFSHCSFIPTAVCLYWFEFELCWFALLILIAQFFPLLYLASPLLVYFIYPSLFSFNFFAPLCVLLFYLFSHLAINVQAILIF